MVDVPGAVDQFELIRPDGTGIDPPPARPGAEFIDCLLNVDQTIRRLRMPAARVVVPESLVNQKSWLGHDHHPTGLKLADVGRWKTSSARLRQMVYLLGELIQPGHQFVVLPYG